MASSDLLSRYLSSTWVGDLQHLAALSGIRMDQLEEIAAARLRPNQDHMTALRRVLPELPAELVLGHLPPVPEVIDSRRGTVPEGYKLTLIPAGELQVGDLVAIRSRQLGSGNHWLAVSRVNVINLSCESVIGGVLTRLDIKSQLRVARPLS